MKSFLVSFRQLRHGRPRWPVATIFLGLALLLMLAVNQVSGAAADSISSAALHRRLNTEAAPLVLDVRSPAAYSAGHIPGARNLPYQEIPDQLAALSAFQEDEVVVYCEVGVRAGIAQNLLEQAGFAQVRPLVGDMRGWREAELPISTANLENTP